MTTREWLNRGFTLYEQIGLKKLKLETMANTIAVYDKDGSSGDHSRNTTESMMIRYSEEKRRIEQMEQELLSIDQETERVLSSIDSPKIHAVMYCRYVARFPWGRIRKHIKLSEAHMYRLHSEGVHKVADIIEGSPDLYL